MLVRGYSSGVYIYIYGIYIGNDQTDFVLIEFPFFFFFDWNDKGNCSIDPFVVISRKDDLALIYICFSIEFFYIYDIFKYIHGLIWSIVFAGINIEYDKR